MLMTTLNRIRAHGPCADGWRALLGYLGKTKADDAPLSFETILESNGIDDALWCLRAEPQHAKEYRLFAVWCARQVQHLMTDPRSLAALDVAERHANGEATHGELSAAWAAAWDAARDAAGAAAGAVAGAAARDAAWDAAWDAAGEAGWAAARAVAGAAARAVARDAARDAAGAAQHARFLKMINEIE